MNSQKLLSSCVSLCYFWFDFMWLGQCVWCKCAEWHMNSHSHTHWMVGKMPAGMCVLFVINPKISGFYVWITITHMLNDEWRVSPVSSLNGRQIAKTRIQHIKCHIKNYKTVKNYVRLVGLSLSLSLSRSVFSFSVESCHNPFRFCLWIYKLTCW